MIIHQNPVTKMDSRQGLTLTEVLATIFILAVGMLSILILFPVGAMKVKAALNNERTALAASNGISNLAILAKTKAWDPVTSTYKPVLDLSNMQYSATLPDARKVAFLDQTAGLATFGLPIQYPQTDSTSGISSQFQIPVNCFSNPLPLINSESAFVTLKKWFTLQDDIEWNESGSVGPVVSRGQSFTTAYLIRAERGLYEVTILVYNGRSPSLYDSANDKQLALGTMADANATGNTAIALSKLPTKEDGRTVDKGSWIVETSNREYEYYQIQSITTSTDAGGQPLFRLELDRPLLRKYGTPNQLEFYWVDFLSGVFPKGQLQFN